MFLTRRVHLDNFGLTIFNIVDRESLVMAGALCVKATTELLVRFLLSTLDVRGRSEVKVLSRADQEVTG